MGYYIEVPENKRKAKQLVDLHSAKIEPGPFFDPTGERVGICVVENPMFDAAAIAFSESEMQVFAEPDGRRRTWLSLPREKVIELCPNVEKFLARVATTNAG